MAHWLLCQSCKQWSKSATPLSNDKFCPLCNNRFATVKSYTSSIPDIISSENTQEPQKDFPIPEADKTKQAEIKESLEALQETETPVITEAVEISETPAAVEAETEDKPEAAERTLNQPEAAEVSETPEDPAIQEPAEEPEAIQITEAQEKPNITAPPEKQKNTLLQKKNRSRNFR
ncbi:MAG: hypothetical protein PHC92_03815 [Syntrophomonadaceae bacterium]|nr:hypothetical protein [Syntrophomonadaceae bacterium]MDD3024015.1 hypothetical protein [Syntrophomonadaceae bacterium]